MEPLQLFPWSESDRLVRLAQQLVEFFVISTLIYAFGRLVVIPGVRWLIQVRHVESTMASAVRKVVRLGILIAAVVLAAAFAGFGALLTGSTLLAAAATVALGIAAQDVIANFVAGAFIVRDRHFNIGDWIEWGEGHVGVIDDISFRVTRIRTFDNEIMTVPNIDLATSDVTNRMGNDTLRITCGFGVEYDADMREVSEVLLSVANRHSHVLADPSPSVRIAELAGDSVQLEARFWIANPSRREYLTVRSEFLQRAAERLSAVDVQVGTTTDLSGTFNVRTTDA